MNGFVYIWRDHFRKKFYIGSHYGTETDGYICSNRWMLDAFKARPETFSRRILERVKGDKCLLLEREQAWLNLINDKHLSSSTNVKNGNDRYYNHKKIAQGGSAKGHTKNRKAPAWNKGVSKEFLSLRRSGLLCLLSDKPMIRAVKPAKKVCERVCPGCKRIFVPKIDRIVSCSIKCRAKVGFTTQMRNNLQSFSNSGRTPWNKGLENKTASSNGKKGASKLSKTNTGRKRLYNSDGTWTYYKP